MQSSHRVAIGAREPWQHLSCSLTCMMHCGCASSRIPNTRMCISSPARKPYQSRYRANTHVTNCTWLSRRCATIGQCTPGVSQLGVASLRIGCGFAFLAPTPQRTTAHRGGSLVRQAIAADARDALGLQGRVTEREEGRPDAMEGDPPGKVLGPPREFCGVAYTLAVVSDDDGTRPA